MSKYSIAFSAVLAVAAATFSLGLSSCSSDDDSSTGGDKDVSKAALKSLGQVESTFYWITIEPNDGKPRDQEVLDVDGNVIAKVSSSYMATLRMEGTGKLLDGRVINFKSKITHPDGTIEIRYRVCGADAPYGYGYQDLVLVPYRSIAVDPSVVAIGSTVFVPAVKGLVLPDGTVHDGMFSAVDVGDMIVQQHIDFFTGFGDQSAMFENHGLVSNQTTEMFLVQ